MILVSLAGTHDVVRVFRDLRHLAVDGFVSSYRGITDTDCRGFSHFWLKPRLQLQGSGRARHERSIKQAQIFFLVCILPGPGGLITSAMVSTYYRNTLPRFPDPQQLRMQPRNISGYIVYQTVEEERKLDLLDILVCRLFLIGLTAGLIYLQKWGLERAIEAEDDEFAAGRELILLRRHAAHPRSALRLETRLVCSLHGRGFRWRQFSARVVALSFTIADARTARGGDGGPRS